MIDTMNFKLGTLVTVKRKQIFEIEPYQFEDLKKNRRQLLCRLIDVLFSK